ncbi:MAG: hypothetical protein ABIG42_01925, partial [bacterium]
MWFYGDSPDSENPGYVLFSILISTLSLREITMKYDPLKHKFGVVAILDALGVKNLESDETRSFIEGL